MEYQPFYPIVKECFGENPPAIVGLSNLFFPILIINKPEPLEDLYINKNKYVDKEQMPKKQLEPLLGDSSLMIKASEE